MQRPQVSQSRQGPIRGPTFRLAVIGQKQNTFNIPSYQSSNGTNKDDNAIFQSLRIHNGYRSKTEERQELVPRGLKNKLYQQSEINSKQAVSILDPYLKEQMKVFWSNNDDSTQAYTKNNYFSTSNRSKLNENKGLNSKDENPKNALLSQITNSSTEKFHSHKFLKPIEGDKTTTERFSKVSDKEEEELVSPKQKKQTKVSSTGGNNGEESEFSPLRLSSANSFDPRETQTIKIVEKINFYDNFSKLNFEGNDSIDHISEENSQDGGDHDKTYLPKIEKSSDGVPPLVVGPDEKKIGSWTTSQTQRSNSPNRKVGHYLLPNAKGSNERPSQPRDFKINTVSPTKQRIRPPTSPTQSVSMVPPANKYMFASTLGKSKVSETFNTRSSKELPPNNTSVNILNSRGKRMLNVAGSLSPTKFKKEDKIGQGKIAEIKQHVLKSGWINAKKVEKPRPYTMLSANSGVGETGENSFIESNLSRDLDGLYYEEDEDVDESCPTNRPGNKKVLLLNSVYAGRPPTIFFTYPSCCEKTRDASRTVAVSPEDEKAYDLKYKSLSIACVTRTFDAAGFKRTEGSNWNALWGQPKYDRVKEMNKYQKTNHFPGCWEVGRKDGLWRNLSKMKRQFPTDFSFIPNTYLLSTDYERFIQIKENAENKAIWIMKPCASACGRGIKLINKKTKLTKKTNYLVSEYISNPHLIDGHKYDLRVYVFVSSFDPLRIYLFQEGLVRFATQKYNITKKNLKVKYAHLTNWSVNKNSENFVKNEGTQKDGEGSKWSFSALRKRFEEMNIDYDEIFDKIKDIIIKTMISVEPLMLNSLSRTPEHKNNCYELYGFDVLLDSNLKPWLMEVNVCPSLNSSTPLDRKIKTSVICDMMNLVGFLPYDKKKFNEDAKNRLLLESRKYNAKNCNEINDLSEQNCLEKLSADDWNILFDTDEENYRRGNFDRIFPLKENINTYSKYFEYQRYNNLIVWQWLKARTNFLEMISQKLSIASC